MQWKKVNDWTEKTHVDRLWHWVSNHGIFLGVVLVSLMLRLWDIDLPMNTDEAKWLSRGDEFLHSLITGNLSETYTSPHPGVSTMWIAGLGMVLNSLVSMVSPAQVGMEAPTAIGQFMNTRDFPIEMYVLPRLLHALVTSLCIGGIYILTRRLFGRAIALLTATLLVLEPFFLAYQRFLTTDALQANFSVLAVLLFLLYLRSQEPPVRRSRWLLILSGVCFGLAIGSKVISLFMVPGILLLALWAEIQGGAPPFPAIGYGARARAIALWGATALVTLVVSWPALWLNAGLTLNRMSEGLIEESQRGFFFFMGDLTHSPGALFYPINLAYRLSPALLVGLILGAIALLVPAWRRRFGFSHEQAALWLVVISYVSILSLASTKIDRYLSPVIPLLAILAAMGWLGLGQRLYAGLKGWVVPNTEAEEPPGAIALLVGVLAITQLLVLLPQVPYYLTYYNPLLGGPRAAEEAIMIGQGEGLDQAARWLAQESRERSWNANQDVAPDQNSPPPVGVATVYPSVMFGYWDRSEPIAIHPLPMRPDEIADPAFWQDTHRVVFYISQLQRQLPNAAFTDYFTTQPYLFEVQQDGINYAKIYPGPLLLPQEVERIPYPVEVTYGDRIRLLGYFLTTTTGLREEQPLLIFYWNTLKSLPRGTRLLIELRDRQGQTVYRTQEDLWGGLFPVQDIRPNTLMRDAHGLNLPGKVSAGTYDLYVGWRSRGAQERFAPSGSGAVVEDGGDGEERGDGGENRGSMAYVGAIAL